MSENKSPYHIVDLPSDRREMPALNELNARKHFMYGLLEVDVTFVKQCIADYRTRTGDLLSFTGYLVYCFARAVDENKQVQAYMKGRKQLLVPENVDVGILVERKKEGARVLVGHVIRGANHKTYREIHDEIRAVQSEPVPPHGGMPGWFRTVLTLPWPLSSVVNALVRFSANRDPTMFTAMAGTVGITAVGMFGKGMSGWGLVPVTHVLDLIVGSATRKPVVVGDEIEPRDILNLTVVFDHDVIDGAPATRFTRRLVELISAGEGLDEFMVETNRTAEYAYA